MSYIVMGITPNEEFLVVSATSEKQYNVGFVSHEEIIKESITDIITSKGTISVGSDYSASKLRDIMQTVLIMVKDLLEVFDSSIPLGSYVEDHSSMNLLVVVHAVSIWENYSGYRAQREDALKYSDLDMSEIVDPEEKDIYVNLEFYDDLCKLCDAEREYLEKQLKNPDGSSHIDVSKAFEE